MKNISFNDNSLVPLCKEHLDELALTLRLPDRRELWAMYRLPAREGLELCSRPSVAALTFIHRGKAGACTGVVPHSLLGRRACVWSWSGEEVSVCSKSFWRASLAALAYFQSLYPCLYAVCDVRYAAAHRYLRHLGARPDGGPFVQAGPETKFQLYRFDKQIDKKEKLWVEH